MKQIIIGIDPDIDKSGVAALDHGDEYFDMWEMTFFEIFNMLQKHKERIKMVYIEAGHLNKKSNWHKYGKGEGVAARIGKNVGSNHQVGRLLEQMCQYLSVPYTMVKPMGKKDVDEFYDITGIKTLKKDQDKRDAAMLIWGR